MQHIVVFFEEKTLFYLCNCFWRAVAAEIRMSGMDMV